MTPFECFKLYIALKNHFRQKTYCYFKYNKKVNVTYPNFEKRIDKYYFQKLAKRQDCEGYLVSNFVMNNNFWVGELNHNQEAEQVYKDWLKRNQSLEYIFKEQLKQIPLASFRNTFIIDNNTHPEILMMYTRGSISPETLCIMVDCIGCYSYLNKNLKNDILWDSIGLLIRKYQPFIKYDKQKYKTIIKQYLKGTL